WPVTNHRRMREHRKLTLLLNVLLRGHTSLQSSRHSYFWASVPIGNDRLRLTWFRRVQKFLSQLFRRRWTNRWTSYETKWVKQYFDAKLGKPIIDELSPAAAIQLEEVEPEQYYETVGHDGKGLRVSTDLDDSISCYMGLSGENRAKFDRATFWVEIASRQW